MRAGKAGSEMLNVDYRTNEEDLNCSKDALDIGTYINTDMNELMNDATKILSVAGRCTVDISYAG